MRNLLVRGLCPRWDWGGLASARTGGAVADREDVGIARGLQCRLDRELVYAVDLQSIDVSQDLRGFDSGRPYHQFRGYERTVGQPKAVRCYFRHSCAGSDLDTH